MNMRRSSNQSKRIGAWLRELSELDVNPRLLNIGAPKTGGAAERIDSLRELIPTSVLRHYDHLRSRGKRSVAPVTRGVCGSCYLAFPSGSLATLRKINETLNVCLHCGAFVYLDEQDQNGLAATSKVTAKKRPSLNCKSQLRRSAPKCRKRRSTR